MEHAYPLSTKTSWSTNSADNAAVRRRQRCMAGI
jgi:hypothetical protein